MLTFPLFKHTLYIIIYLKKHIEKMHLLQWAAWCLHMIVCSECVSEEVCLITPPVLQKSLLHRLRQNCSPSLWKHWATGEELSYLWQRQVFSMLRSSLLPPTWIYLRWSHGHLWEGSISSSAVLRFSINNSGKSGAWNRGWMSSQNIELILLRDTKLQ